MACLWEWIRPRCQQEGFRSTLDYLLILHLWSCFQGGAGGWRAPLWRRIWVRWPRRDTPPTPVEEKIDQSSVLMSRVGVTGVTNRPMDDKRLHDEEKRLCLYRGSHAGCQLDLIEHSFQKTHSNTQKKNFKTVEINSASKVMQPFWVLNLTTWPPVDPSAVTHSSFVWSIVWVKNKEAAIISVHRRNAQSSPRIRGANQYSRSKSGKIKMET